MPIIQSIANNYLKEYIKETSATYPIKLSELCRHKGIKLAPYSDKNVQSVIEQFDLKEHTINNDGFVIGNVIFWDDTESIERQRATIAHELGHIVLHCGSQDLKKFADCAHCIELQADSFALNFLFPAERMKCC